MPTRISVAISTETGPPEDESWGVTCELEFDEGLIVQDRQIVERAFQHVVAACQQAIQEAAVLRP